jgi:hypothetical protein
MSKIFQEERYEGDFLDDLTNTTKNRSSPTPAAE